MHGFLVIVILHCCKLTACSDTTLRLNYNKLEAAISAAHALRDGKQFDLDDGRRCIYQDARVEARR